MDSPRPSALGYRAQSPRRPWGRGRPLHSRALSPQTSVCAKIVQLLGQHEVDCRQRKVVIVSQDSFYRVLTSEQKAKALRGQFNFDHPGEPGAWRGAGWDAGQGRGGDGGAA